MATHLVLIRHGQTPWTISGQHTGSTDLALTADGERSASSLRPLLETIPFAHVFTSPLQRARRTCALAGLGDMARVEPELREWDYGAYEGRTTAAIHAERPGWNIFRDGCPDGETVEQVGHRADRVLERLQAMDGLIALFSHGHFLRAVAARWIGRPVKDGQHLVLDTSTIGVLGYEHPHHDVPVISLWNAGPVDQSLRNALDDRT